MLKILKSKNKSTWHGIRVPARLEEMIIDMQRLLSANYTEALMIILMDWEKFRYLEEKERLLKLAKLRFQLLREETKKP